MENLGKQVGYLKGLLAGANIDTESVNGKLMSGIVELLGELSDRVEAMDELIDDLNDYVESIDDDLAALEEGDDGEDYFDDDEDEALDFDDDFDAEDQLHLLQPAAPKAGAAAKADEEEDEEDDAGDALSGNLCPECSRMFFTNLSDGEGAEYICPHCGKRVKPMPLTPDNAPIARPVQDF